MPVARRILFCACLSYTISQFYRSANAVIGPDLMIELALTPEDLGILTGAFFLTFSISQFPVGIALDRWGPRRTILAARSASIRNGIGNLFEAVIWLLMKPGMMTLTPIPFFFRLPRSDSPQTRTAAFDAP